MQKNVICKKSSIHIHGGKYSSQNRGWVGYRGFWADCIILPEPTLEWQIDISVGPEPCINTPHK